MNIKRFIALVLSALLLIGASSAMAARAGSAEDPLVSLSYLKDSFTNTILGFSRSALDLAAESVYGRYYTAIKNGGSAYFDELPKGETVNLRMGGSLVLAEGSATVKILFGSVINVSTGARIMSGEALSPGQRYFAAEHTLATVTMLSNSVAALDGDAMVGETPATFSDVRSSHWAFAYIEAMAERSLVNGKGNGIFDPSANMTRADFITVLGRLYGVDADEYAGAPFTDVAPGLYYSAYVDWAVKAGIVTGYGNGRFGPSDQINRAQMACVIMRFAEYCGVSVPSGADTAFSDDAVIPSWAKKDVYAARNLGLITGRDGNIYAPLSSATRAEVCAIVCRLIDLL